MPEDHIKIYCDGACRGNPGIGGWGVVLLYKEYKKEENGVVQDTTNNRMELTAAIEALQLVKNPEIPIRLYTDSRYVQQGMTKWIIKWRKFGWDNIDIKNVDLWQLLDNLASGFQIEWLWVKGHAGDIYNVRADQLANLAIDESYKLKGLN